MNTPQIVRVEGGKYHGCILTYVRKEPLGNHVVIIGGTEHRLELSTKCHFREVLSKSNTETQHTKPK